MTPTSYMAMNLISLCVLSASFGLIVGYGWGKESRQTVLPDVAEPATVKPTAPGPLPLLLEIEMNEQGRKIAS